MVGRNASRLAVVGVLASAAVIALAAHGVVSAADAGQISACVNNSSGTIHIVSDGTRCSSNEIPLSWTSGGSPVDAFEYDDSRARPVSSDGTVEIARLRLPASGSYVVSAKVYVGNGSAEPARLGCILWDRSTQENLDSFTVNLEPMTIPESTVNGLTLPLQAGGTFSSSPVFTVDCFAWEGSPEAGNVSLIALRVGSFTRVTFTPSPPPSNPTPSPVSTP